MLEAKWRIWFERDGKSFFGSGRARLLAAISEEGSLSGGARKIGMAYRTAWGHLKAMEDGFGAPLITRRTGGRGGGGCGLTPDGKRLLESYLAFREAMEADRDRHFERYLAWTREASDSPRKQ